MQSLVEALNEPGVRMSAQLEIAFSPDRNMLAPLHVAARSVLTSHSGIPEFLILSTELEDDDIDLLRDTLEKTGRKYLIRFLRRKKSARERVWV